MQLRLTAGYSMTSLSKNPSVSVSKGRVRPHKMCEIWWWTLFLSSRACAVCGKVRGTSGVFVLVTPYSEMDLIGWQQKWSKRQ